MLFGLNNFKIIGDENSLIMFDDQANVGIRCKNVILESVTMNTPMTHVDIGPRSRPIQFSHQTETSIKLLSYEAETITQLPDSDDEKSIVELLKLIKHKLDGRE